MLVQGTKMNNKSTGPRTPQGKARSSQNAMKHKILVGRILPEEKNQASLFFTAFQQELQSQGVLELEIVADIVLNRLQKRRIDRYMANEFEKSRTLDLSNWVKKKEESMARYWRRRDTISAGRSLGSDCDRLPPNVCFTVLVALKSKIQERGLVPDQDLTSLYCIYGNQLTECAAMIVHYYNEIKSDEKEYKEDDQARKSKHAEYQREILEALEKEMGRQGDRFELATALDNLACMPGVPAPPPDPILDSILRYTSANAREFIHLLNALKRIRGLKAGG
jgi:hypothetical protein